MPPGRADRHEGGHLHTHSTGQLHPNNSACSLCGRDQVRRDEQVCARLECASERTNQRANKRALANKRE